MASPVSSGHHCTALPSPRIRGPGKETTTDGPLRTASLRVCAHVTLMEPCEAGSHAAGIRFVHAQ